LGHAHSRDDVDGNNYRIKKQGTRVSVFVDPDPKMVEGAKRIGADRIELFTEPYAKMYGLNKEAAVKGYVESAIVASELGLGINAGHDLDLHNLAFFKASVTRLAEVSIGHALITDALCYGLERTIQMYKSQLNKL